MQEFAIKKYLRMIEQLVFEQFWKIYEIQKTENKLNLGKKR